MQAKIVEWLRRYLPAEMLAIVTALLGGLMIDYLFHNAILTALGSAWADNVGYYGKILWNDVQERIKKDEAITILGMIKVLRNTIIEFGVAEYMDMILRPIIIYFCTHLFGNITFGLLLGKFAADVTFYFPTIFFYEFRKKAFRD